MMRFTRYFFFMLLLAGVPLLAQDFPEPDTIFTDEDETYSIQYPGEWFAEERFGVLLISPSEEVAGGNQLPGPDQVLVAVVSPQVAAESFGIAVSEDLQALGEAFIASESENMPESATFSDLVIQTLDNGNSTVASDYDDPASGVYQTFVIVVGANDVAVIAAASGSAAFRDAVRPIAMQMAESLEFIVDPNRPTLVLDWVVQDELAVVQGFRAQLAVSEDAVYMLELDGGEDPDVLVISPDGETVTEIANPDITNPRGLTILPDGSLFIINGPQFGNALNTIYRISAEGETLAEIPGVADTFVDYPRPLDILTDADGDVHVLAAGTGAVLRVTYSVEGELLGSGPLPLEPVVPGVTLDVKIGPDGRFYTMDVVNGISIFDENWDMVETGILLDTIREATFPTGMVITEDGRFVLAANAGQSIWVVDDDGTVLGRYIAGNLGVDGLTELAITAMELAPDGAVLLHSATPDEVPSVVIRFTIEAP